MTVAEPRSFVYRRLADHDRGEFLSDRSLAPRCGYKGRDALAWLARIGITVPDANNRAVRQNDALVCRLADGEAMILSGGDVAERLAAAWADQRPDGCYPVPRADSHAWFRLAGRDPAAVLARLASVDFRPASFDDLAIAQTFVARVAAVVVRDGDAFDILADSASALYLWDCILDALGENP
jgi:sarcosine oxidase subunit gamma